jgi:uncharacterized lipoprotein YmbA
MISGSRLTRIALRSRNCLTDCDKLSFFCRTISHPFNLFSLFNPINQFNSPPWYFRSLLVALIALLLTGCLFKTTIIPPRSFVLSPILTNEPASTKTGQLSVGIGFVKLPSYLLRNSIAVRNGANEIKYLEDALWAERLDLGFQRAIAANLSRLLPSESIYLSDWGRDQVMARIFIDVEQFDVDVQGRGTLIAHWRITAPESDVPLKIGEARLVRPGAEPRGSPDVILTALSNLAGDFSRDLALSIRDSVKPKP